VNGLVGAPTVELVKEVDVALSMLSLVLVVSILLF